MYSYKLPIFSMAVTTALAAGLFLHGGLHFYYRDQLFAAKGVRVIGTITGLRVHDGGRGTSYSVSYNYITGGQDRLESSDFVNRATCRQFRVGGAIPIDYLPDNPTVNRIDIETEKIGLLQYAYGFCVTGLALSVVSTCLWIIVIYWIVKKLRSA